MPTSFDAAWAESVIEQLRNRGVEVAAGLADDDIADIDAAFGVPVPEELALFLRAGLPVSPRWVDWRKGASTILRETEAWLDGAFAFDIERSGYWHPLLGVRPTRLEDAILQATTALRGMPPVLPIYAHRFLTTGAEPRAVLSIWQAVDSIVYGNDLADYFAREFMLPRPAWATTENPPVPDWEDLFDLYGTGIDSA